MTDKSQLGEYSDVSRSYSRNLGTKHGHVKLSTFSPAYPLRELSIVAEHSAAKPDEFVSMLRAMADEIERIADAERVDRTPFLIDGMLTDVMNGCLTVVFHDNE